VRQPRLSCCTLLSLLLAGSAGSAHAAYSDAAVKAAFLYRFTGYIDWPPATLQAGQFTVAVLGSRPVAQELALLLEKYPIKSLPGHVRLVDDAKQALDVQMLYVGTGYRGDLREVADAVGNRPMLLVTDHAGALDEGSAVNFLVVDRRVRFEVSLAATHRAGLKVSSQLLAVASHVRGAGMPLRPCAPPWTLAVGAEHGCRVRMAAR
jgi:hypothetical protein